MNQDDDNNKHPIFYDIQEGDHLEAVQQRVLADPDVLEVRVGEQRCTPLLAAILSKPARHCAVFD